MAAKPKYTPRQLDLIWLLYEEGHKSAQIAERCALGTATVPGFEISPRYVRELLHKLARERGHHPPRTLAETRTAEALRAYGPRVVSICEDELARIERKQRKNKPLSTEDVRLLRDLRRVHEVAERITRKKPPRPINGRNAMAPRKKDGAEPKSALGQLARINREREEAEAPKSSEPESEGSARTQTEADSPAESTEAILGRLRRLANEHGNGDAAGQ